MAIYNAGGGLAKGTGFVLAVGDRYTLDFVGDGFLKAGHSVQIHTEMPPAPDEEMRAVVFCHDLEGRSYVWNRKGQHKRVRRTRRRPWHDGRDIWAKHYADVDLHDLEKVPCRIQMSDWTL
jgi:hypothetical protein